MVQLGRLNRQLYLTDSDFRVLIADNLEILSEKRSQSRRVIIKFGEELPARASEAVERSVIQIVKHLALKEFPKALDQVQIRTVRRERLQLNS